MNQDTDTTAPPEDGERRARTLVYRYGLLAPDEKPMVVEMMHAAHQYKNNLIAIERARRTVVRDACTVGDAAALAEAHAAALAEVERLVAEVKRARSAARARVETSEIKAQLRMARAKCADAARLVREARARMRADAGVAQATEAANERASILRKAYRADCGVYWGTYLLVEAAVLQAGKAPLFQDGQPSDPHFVPWRGEGQVSVQIGHGMTVAQLLSGEDTRARITGVDGAAWYAPRRCQRRQKVVLWLRVTSGGPSGREPVWVRFPMLMHRPLPQDASIKVVTVNRRFRGPREVWSVDITLQTHLDRSEGATEDAVAVDIGWRTVPGADGAQELLVATWVGTDGRTGEQRLTAHQLGGFAKVAELASLRDRLFNEMRDMLALALKEQAAAAPTTRWAPDWMLAERPSDWRSPGRASRFLTRWQEARGLPTDAGRLEGGDTLYDLLLSWHHQDHHLWAWESGQRGHSIGNRRETYRILGAQLARRYKEVAFADTDLRPLARRASTAAPADVAQNETARGHRHLASPGDLRATVAYAFTARNGHAREVPALDQSRTCSACGALSDASEDPTFRCSACGHTEGRDLNTARVLLARWRELPPPEAKKAPAAGKWQRAKQKKSEKTNPQEAAGIKAEVSV